MQASSARAKKIARVGTDDGAILHPHPELFPATSGEPGAAPSGNAAVPPVAVPPPLDVDPPAPVEPPAPVAPPAAAVPASPVSAPNWNAPRSSAPVLFRTTAFRGWTYSNAGMSANPDPTPGSTPLPIAGDPLCRW
jgi:hypothetical protein